MILEQYLPKDILDNILYKYLTYEDLIKFTKANILDHLQILSYKSGGANVGYELFLDGKTIHSFDNKLSEKIVDDFNIKFYQPEDTPLATPLVTHIVKLSIISSCSSEYQIIYHRCIDHKIEYIDSRIYTI